MAEVRWTRTALKDLDDIGAYIAEDSPRSAEKVIRRILETGAALAYHPQMGRPGHDPTTRELVVTGTPYITVYRIGTDVEVLTILHAFRQWPGRFS